MIATVLSRREGHEAIKPYKPTIAASVIEALQSGDKTAEEIADLTGMALNNARSRLTELRKAGKVETVGRKLNPRSNVKITIWRLKNEN